MALYVSIDEGYCVFKLSGIDAVVEAALEYTLQDGRKLTKALAKKEIKNGSFNLYDYDEDQLADAIENGSVRSVDWTIKIQTI